MSIENADTHKKDARGPSKVKTQDKGKLDLNALKAKCPMPMLMKKLGMEQYAKKSCPSPFRTDKDASWGIFEGDKGWMFKDFGTGEFGDEINLLAKVKKMDSKKDFVALLKYYDQIAHEAEVVVVSAGTELKAEAMEVKQDSAELKEKPKPNREGFGPGSVDQITELAELRGYKERALMCAQGSELLVFGKWNGLEVYGITDCSGRVLEIRRLDGKPFSSYGGSGQRKSHAIKNSCKSWPVGIIEAANKPCIALAEGLPDFLALFDCLNAENAFADVGPVAMLSASCAICPEALPHFKDKHVRIYPHVDQAGIKAARRWEKQLKEAGAEKVDFFDFFPSKCKDLCEFKGSQRYIEREAKGDWRVLP